MKFDFYLSAWGYCFREQIDPTWIHRDGKQWTVNVEGVV